MAFCVRSERKMEFQKKRPSIPGPGQYIKLIIKNEAKDKTIFPPFQASAKRGPLMKIKDVPGPGSYNLDDNKPKTAENVNYEKNINDKEEDKLQDIIITNFNTKEKNYNNNSIITNIMGKNSSITNSSKFNNISLIKDAKKNKSFTSKDINLQSLHNSKISDQNLASIINNLEEEILSSYYQNEKLGFLSQATRFNKKRDIDTANSPGPGSYYEPTSNTTNETKNKIKKGNKKLKAASLVEKTGSLNRVISIPSKMMNGYIYEDKNNKKSEIETTSINNSIEDSTYSKNKNLFNNTFQNYHNSSFLMNNTKYNNDNKSNKDLKLLINNAILMSDNINTSTNELVGPGSYNVSLIEKNNNIVNWSNGFCLKKINQKNELKKKLKLIEEMKKKGECNIYNKNLYKTNFKKFQKILSPCLSQKQMKIPKSNSLNNEEILSFRTSFIPNKSDIPGPGYYSNELIKPENDILSKDRKEEENNNEKINKIPEISNGKYICGNLKIFQNFGSNCERPFNKSKSLEDLGPTTYFKQKNKFEPKKKKTIYDKLILGKTQMSRTVRNNFDFYFPDVPNDNDDNQNEILYKSKTNRGHTKIPNTSSFFNPNTKRENSSLEKNRKNSTILNSQTLGYHTNKSKTFYDIPGPGAYELSQTFIKPSFSSTQMMKSNVKRFPSNNNGNPGPGTYQNLHSLGIEGKIILKKVTDKKYKSFGKDLFREKKIKKIIEINKKKREVPGVGTYNPEKNNSIIYKIYSKLNFRQSFQSPFLNSSERFIQHKNNEKISPSSYEPYKYEKEQKNIQYMAFNKANRLNDELDGIKKNDWFLAGPGSYDLRPEWNKKSYNILFSANQ